MSFTIQAVLFICLSVRQDLLICVLGVHCWQTKAFQGSACHPAADRLQGILSSAVEDFHKKFSLGFTIFSLWMSEVHNIILGNFFVWIFKQTDFSSLTGVNHV